MSDSQAGAVLARLRGALVVSCQPVERGPMDDPEIVAAMAMAAEAGGAGGLRIEGSRNLAAVRPRTSLPIIAIVKRDLQDSPVRITPRRLDVERLTAGGADIIAYDATARRRPEPTAKIVDTIKRFGKIAMADCANLEDAERAMREGADIVGTTLSGYTDPRVPASNAPDIQLVRDFRSLQTFVMAEGRYHTPDLARQAMAAGADSVTVGSAVTRIEHVTGWYVDAIGRNRGE